MFILHQLPLPIYVLDERTQHFAAPQSEQQRHQIERFAWTSLQGSHQLVGLLFGEWPGLCCSTLGPCTTAAALKEMYRHLIA